MVASSSSSSKANLRTRGRRQCHRAKIEPGLCLSCGKLTIFRPYCPKHRIDKLRLSIKTSTIPNAGFGVFALKQHKTNDLVCRYYSEYLSRPRYRERYGGSELAEYVLEFKPKEYVDGSIQRGVDMMINHVEKTDTRCNVEFREEGIFAIKDIQPGDELLVDYGPEYWG